MATKRYKLQPHAVPFSRPSPGGPPEFKFRVRFGQPLSGGRTRVCAKKKCPILILPLNGVIETDNLVAQYFLENFTAPNKTRRNGAARIGGLLFADVTATVTEYDLHLDSLLPS